MGKTVTTEFANRHPGPDLAPAEPDAYPGRLVGGSAAAVADFMAPLALGTQTGRSVIRPAAYCGVVGFKPSFGLYPPAGMHPNTESLDTVGTMARSVEDTALFRAALMAIPYEPPRPPDRPPRLALCRTMHWERAQPEGRAALKEPPRGCAKPARRSSTANCRPNARTSPRPSGATAPTRRRASMRRNCAAIARS